MSSSGVIARSCVVLLAMACGGKPFSHADDPSRAGAGGAGGAGAGAGGARPSSGAGGVPAGPIREGLVLWLDADDAVTETDGAVARWEGRSGTAAYATQSVRAERPELVSASGSRRMVEFDGVDDSLRLSNGFDDFRSGMSFFAVVEVLGMPACSSIVQLSNGDEKDDIDFGLKEYSVSFEVDDSWFHGPAAYALDERILVGVTLDADLRAELRVNGEFLHSQPVTAAPPATLRGDNFVGRSLYAACGPLHARIGEILLYARALDTPERLAVESYLGLRWE